MTRLDVLSDTIYRHQAIVQLDRLLEAGDSFPIERTQVYGLRQISRQQPLKVSNFAEKQRTRVERKMENTKVGTPSYHRMEDEVRFWKLVTDLCDSSPSNQDWTLGQTAGSHLPPELNQVPDRQKGMTHEDRTRRNQLKKEKREWEQAWYEAHIPAFFERFCTHYLFRMALQNEE